MLFITLGCNDSADEELDCGCEITYYKWLSAPDLYTKLGTEEVSDCFDVSVRGQKQRDKTGLEVWDFYYVKCDVWLND